METDDSSGPIFPPERHGATPKAEIPTVLQDPEVVRLNDGRET